MKISKKCRYGLRALIDLSMHSGTEYMVLGNIAERNNISPQYLEQVFAGLRRAGIVKGVKGSQGGYRLNIPPEELTVSEILEDSHGRGVAASIQQLIIDRMNEQMELLLKNITLDDLRKNYLDYEEYNQDMYYI